MKNDVFSQPAAAGAVVFGKVGTLSDVMDLLRFITG